MAQREGAWKIDVDDTTMSHIESGRRRLKIEDMAGLRAVYKVVGEHRRRLYDLARRADEQTWLQTKDYESDFSTYAWLENRALTIAN